MKLMITGSTGFIGQFLWQRLKSNFDLVSLEADLRNYKEIQEEVNYKQPEIVLHLAAKTEVEKSFYEPMLFSETNYLGTVNLAESLLKNPNFKQFVFASTMETYGWQPISDELKAGIIPDTLPVFDESTPQNPNASYSVAKVGCERYLEYLGRAHNFPYTILRQTNTYGRVDNDFFVVEQMITQMLNKSECNFGYPEPFRNFLYITDLLDAYESVINQKNAIQEIFTLGPPNAIQISSLAEMISKKLNWSGEINWYTRPKRPGEIYLLNSSYQHILNKIGWYPKISLDKGLDLTIDKWIERV